MDNHTIAFIICSNNDMLLNECLLFINNLIVPNDITVQTIVVKETSSMTSGYNEAMNSSDAKYKVYLHQDVLITNKNFIYDILSVFEDKNVGMLGVVGNTSLPESGCPWEFGENERIGEACMDHILFSEHKVFSKVQPPYQEAIVLDGLLMATQYDIPWREDLFKGWHLYDCSQSIEFQKAGYKVVVPAMDTSWCIHENDIVNLKDYEKWRAVFENEYKNYYFQ